VIFSKAQAGRFPSEGEVEELFESLKSNANPSKPEKPKSSDRSVLSRVVDKLRN